MAKLTGKKWYDSLEWSARDPYDTVTIFGTHYPHVVAIHVYKSVEHDNPIIRWRNRTDDEIHEFELRPDGEYDDPMTQLKALLVAIKLSA